MSAFDITKVKKLERKTAENNLTPKMTLDGLKRMCNLLDEENPTTYEIFLKYRHDLSDEEVAYYKDIIATLKENQQIRMEQMKERGLITYQDYLARLEPPKIFIDNVEL